MLVWLVKMIIIYKNPHLQCYQHDWTDKWHGSGFNLVLKANFFKHSNLPNLNIPRKNKCNVT
jgi:hypothetical protein